MSIIVRTLILALYGLFVMSALALPIDKVLLSTPRNVDQVACRVMNEHLSSSSAGEVTDKDGIEAIQSTPRRCLTEDAARRGNDDVWPTPCCYLGDVSRRGGNQIWSTPRHVDTTEESTP